MKRFWLSTALLIVLAVPLGHLLSSLFEARVYDQKARLFAPAAPAAVVLVKIDQESLDFYSRNAGLSWPWPRSLYARAIDYLAASGARAVILDLIFSEPGLYGGEDEWLAASIARADRVFLPLFFLRGEGTAEGLERFALPWAPRLSRMPAREGKVQLPLPPLLGAARGGGNAQDDPDPDHVYRRIRHFVRRGGRVYPSLSLAAARFAEPGLDLRRLPFAADGGLNLRFYRRGSFPTFAIAQLIQSQVRREAGEAPIVPAGAIAGRIAVIGATATGLLDNRATPVNASGSGFELHATALANLLRRDFIRVIDPRLQWLLVLLAIIAWHAVLSGIRSLPWMALAAFGIVLLALGLNLLLFFLGRDLDFIPLAVGLAACSGTDAYSRYQRMRREKRFIQNAFKNYLSDSLLAEIMKNPQALNLGGEKKRVTVFFSDLAGFTTLSETLAPEGVVRILNDYLERMTSIIMAEGGFVNKFEGDAIMAFWGAPLPSDSQALQAMAAALRCQEELGILNEEFAREGLPRLGMRIGINSGDVIVGNIGSRQRFEYTVIGDAVNLASRLEGINKQYGTRIICGSLSARMAAAGMRLRRLDRVRVKGKKVPEEIFEVVAREGSAGEAPAALARFGQGLELYFKGDFTAALEVFMTLPDDPPAQVFAKRCLWLLDNPPGDWDGCWTFTEK